MEESASYVYNHNTKQNKDNIVEEVQIVMGPSEGGDVSAIVPPSWLESSGEISWRG